MISKLLKFGVGIIAVLVIFAFLPKGFLEQLRHSFSWGVFFNILKTGFENLIKFTEGVTGVKLDFYLLLSKIKNIFGIDFLVLWSSLKKSLADFFQRLANSFK